MIKRCVRHTSALLFVFFPPVYSDVINFWFLIKLEVCGLTFMAFKWSREMSGWLHQHVSNNWGSRIHMSRLDSTVHQMIRSVFFLAYLIIFLDYNYTCEGPEGSNCAGLLSSVVSRVRWNKISIGYCTDRLLMKGAVCFTITGVHYVSNGRFTSIIVSHYIWLAMLLFTCAELLKMQIKLSQTSCFDYFWFSLWLFSLCHDTEYMSFFSSQNSWQMWHLFLVFLSIENTENCVIPWVVRTWENKLVCA